MRLDAERMWLPPARGWLVPAIYVIGTDRIISSHFKKRGPRCTTSHIARTGENLRMILDIRDPRPDLRRLALTSSQRIRVRLILNGITTENETSNVSNSRTGNHDMRKRSDIAKFEFATLLL
jgi:hypothetical protein